MPHMISRTFIVFLSITQVVSQDIQVSQGQHVDRRLQQQAYGTSQTQDTSYQAAAPPAAAYSAEASNVLPTTPYKVEVRLGCSCSLNIPCFDMKSKKCVPVICGKYCKIAHSTHRHHYFANNNQQRALYFIPNFSFVISRQDSMGRLVSLTIVSPATTTNTTPTMTMLRKRRRRVLTARKVEMLTARLIKILPIETFSTLLLPRQGLVSPISKRLVPIPTL